MTDLSLYIHIPFCVRKCNYCDFLSAPCDEEVRQKYVDALCREIQQRSKEFRDKKVDTIFFGGGTPSILLAKQMEQILVTIRKEFQVLPEAEISMEMNPGTVDREKLETYKKLGVNRLSIGLQSANNDELKILGRIHTWEDFLQTWELVKEVGFTNVNIDLMSALPRQTLESYEETLRKVLALKPEHISAYSLIVEEGTLFYEWFGNEEKNENQAVEEVKGQYRAEEIQKLGNKTEHKTNGNLSDENTEEQMDAAMWKLPDEDTERRMYELTKQLLEEQGYYRYEISNYALKGYECKHNIGYWKRKEYLGLGLGAASLIFAAVQQKQMEDASLEKISEDSFISNIRCTNITDLQEYISVSCEQEMNWMEDETTLSLNDQMEEFMFLGLRMMEGVSPTEFEEQFGRALQDVYGEQIEKLKKQGLLMMDEETGNYALTLRGIDVSNQVFVEFIK